MLSPEKQPTKIAIIGAGLLGRMLAVALTEPNKFATKFDITLFDKDGKRGSESAAYLAAAMLAPVAESAEASELVKAMGQHALKLWPEFIQQLDEPVFFQQQGSLILAHEQDESYLKDFQRRLKLTPEDQIQRINQQKLSELEPALKDQSKRFKHAVFIENEGQLDNRQLLKSMATTLSSRDVNWQPLTAIDFKDNTKLLTTLQQSYDWVIDCRGIGAQKDLASTARLRGVRGEVIRVHAPDVDIKRPVRLMHPRYPIYIAPKEHNHFVVGATQIESEDQRLPTVRSSLELLSSCFSVHSGFAEAEVLEMRSGLRPAFDNNEPKIFSKGNYLQVNGLYRHGYLLAPTIIQQCLAIINKTQQPLPFSSPLIEQDELPVQNQVSRQA